MKRISPDEVYRGVSFRGKYRKTRKRELIRRIQYLSFEEQSSFGTRQEQIKTEIVKLQADIKQLDDSLPDRK